MLLREFPNIVHSVSYTTRPRRPNEVHGKDYYFCSKEEFQGMVDRGEFAEWAEVHSNLYGTPKKNIETVLKNGNHILFDIDVKGVHSLKKSFPNKLLSIFILPPSMKELEKRLRERKEDSNHSIETRLQNAYNEVGWSTTFDHEIINDNLERAFQELREIIARECL